MTEVDVNFDSIEKLLCVTDLNNQEAMMELGKYGKIGYIYKITCNITKKGYVGQNTKCVM